MPSPGPAYRATLSRRERGKKGFTLVEVLVTMTVVAVLLPVIMAGVSAAMSLGSTARQQTQAAMLASSKLNELVAAGAWSAGEFTGDFGADWPGYRWTTVVQSWNDANLLQVEMTVNWTQRSQARAVTLTTLVYTGDQ